MKEKKKHTSGNFGIAFFDHGSEIFTIKGISPLMVLKKLVHLISLKYFSGERVV
jgi:hypothetical protein